MDNKTQLELQAFFDGELPDKQAREMAARLARDDEAGNLLAELRNTRQTLIEFEPEQKLPESREFYWSKIAREINRNESRPEAIEKPASLFASIRRFLVPAGAMAGLAICAAVAVMQSGIPGSLQTEATFAKSDAFTYHDDANGTTLVWLTFPAEREFADNAAH